MTNCEFFYLKDDKHYCKIAEDLSGTPCGAIDSLCKGCLNSETPKQLNRHTVATALLTLHKKDKKLASELAKKHSDILKSDAEVASRQAENALPCIHRGQKIGHIDCKCQGGNNVFSCRIFGEVALRKLLPGTPEIIYSDGIKAKKDINYCIGCDRREELKSFHKFNPDYYHSYEDLISNAKYLASHINRFQRIKGVAGVPRSGVVAASVMATHLGVPLYYISNQGLIGPTHGARLKNVAHEGKILIVDDSVNTGEAMRNLSVKLGRDDYIYAAVYATSKGSEHLDFAYTILELPHWFEWWFFGSQMLFYQKVGTDLDGIICEDCPPYFDDDGPRYKSWMENVLPLRHFYPHGVPYVITARLEKYREDTKRWLDKNRQVVGRVIHAPYKDIAERSKHSIAQFKAEKCTELGIEVFIESDILQAIEMSNLINIPIICPAMKKVLNHDKGNYIF